MDIALYYWFMILLLLTPILYYYLTSTATNHKHNAMRARMVSLCACNGRILERDITGSPPLDHLISCLKADRGKPNSIAKARLISVVSSDRRSRHSNDNPMPISYIALNEIAHEGVKVRLRLLKAASRRIQHLFKAMIELINMKGDKYNDNQKGR